MTMRTPVRVIPLLLSPSLATLAGCDDHHDVQVEVTAAVTAAALERVEQYPIVVVAALRVVPEPGWGDSFEIGWEAIGRLDGPNAGAFTGVVESGFGPCTPADVDVLVQLAAIDEGRESEPLEEVTWRSSPLVEVVAEGAFELNERCTRGREAIDLEL